MFGLQHLIDESLLSMKKVMRCLAGCCWAVVLAACSTPADASLVVYYMTGELELDDDNGHGDFASLDGASVEIRVVSDTTSPPASTASFSGAESASYTPFSSTIRFFNRPSGPDEILNLDVNSIRVINRFPPATGNDSLQFLTNNVSTDGTLNGTNFDWRGDSGVLFDGQGFFPGTGTPSPPYFQQSDLLFTSVFGFVFDVDGNNSFDAVFGNDVSYRVLNATISSTPEPASLLLMLTSVPFFTLGNRQSRKSPHGKTSKSRAAVEVSELVADIH